MLEKEIVVDDQMPALFMDSMLVLSPSAQAVDADISGSVQCYLHRGAQCSGMLYVNASKSTSQRPAIKQSSYCW